MSQEASIYIIEKHVMFFYYSASNIGYNVGRENETCIRTVAALLRSCVLDSREECFGVAWLVLIRVPQCLF